MKKKKNKQKKMFRERKFITKLQLLGVVDFTKKTKETS